MGNVDDRSVGKATLSTPDERVIFDGRLRKLATELYTLAVTVTCLCLLTTYFMTYFYAPISTIVCGVL